MDASDDPADQDKAREIRVMHDYASLKKQIGSKKKPQKAAVDESRLDKDPPPQFEKGDADRGNPDYMKSVSYDDEKKWERLQRMRKASKKKEVRDKVEEGKLTSVKATTYGMPPEERKALIDAERKRQGVKPRPKKNVEEEVGISSTVEMEKAKKEAALRRKEQQAVDKEKKALKKEEVVVERLGGKGTSRKAGAAKIHPTSGDWPDSDRGAGNRAKKRAGGKVEKKSPTYLAHVHNKEEVEPVIEGADQKRTTKGRWVDAQGRSHNFSVSTRTGDRGYILSFIKAKFPAKQVIITGQSKEKAKKKPKGEVNETVSGGVPMTPQELEIQKKMSRLNMRLARKRNQEMQKAKVQDTETAPEQVKEDKAFDNVVAALRAKHGKDAVLTKDSPKPKPQPKPKAKPQKPLTADEKAHREVIARYGGEANYKAGRGLGT